MINYPIYSCIKFLDINLVSLQKNILLLILVHIEVLISLIKFIINVELTYNIDYI